MGFYAAKGNGIENYFGEPGEWKKINPLFYLILKILGFKVRHNIFYRGEKVEILRGSFKGYQGIICDPPDIKYKLHNIDDGERYICSIKGNNLKPIVK